MHLAPSAGSLYKAELELALMRDSIESSKFHRLKKMLDTVKDQYHYVLIDCHGGLGLLTLNALCASDEIIAVTSVGKFERNATRQFLKDIKSVMAEYSPATNILGVLLTMTDPYQITEKTRKKMQSIPEVSEKMFRTEIPKNNAIRNATDEDKSIWTYDPFSSSAKAYIKLWEEIKSRLGI
jgi:chromosome partitioning protein